ncbi:hypothetical protein [Gimesia algae]|uniref:Uncharacterized protein n=1 Tax=Gimesia algae TaxID=2527971 RepID=A0A517VB23_9PLAN|nr:hypothetical protein [Gimesia algae]QDT90202.1 hypothetical protein Pan161_18520 [Gimesia algae]
MLKRVTSWLNSLLLSPPALCVMLVIFFTGSLLLCNNLIQVDAEGRPLTRKRTVFENHPVTQELIEATSELNWQTDPEQVIRVDELCEELAQMKLDREQNITSAAGVSKSTAHQDWFVNISVPARQTSIESIRQTEM